ncbi:L,D-transpeptidase family protein [Clostridium scatologenes]|uniref:ErfK/YbiS/YcfS/YnhG family protein n=1 Tax=Clostridium scatologenes TaxID=1548 RepID=A0A0E3MAN0_CLOSL|nr:L,D-transpeptidase family protein [Clostridium scatologenes]AKA72250.1 ErfK/YbiS/YcfS/YnhG family protein [Clostridium scatologenes]
MKNHYKKFPLVFLIFGIFLIVLISGISIKKYIKTKEADNSKQVLMKKSADSTKENEKLFFNKQEAVPEKASIKVYKKRRVLELYSSDKLVGRFKIGLGRSPEGYKEKEGDNKTPEGSYYICYRNGNTKYTYFIGISYPNIEDAKRGLQQGLINEATYKRIERAVNDKRQPPWNTPLGGEVGLHGGGNKYDWSYGCIALTDEDINILKQYAPNGTTIEIYK